MLQCYHIQQLVQSVGDVLTSHSGSSKTHETASERRFKWFSTESGHV